MDRRGRDFGMMSAYFEKESYVEGCGAFFFCFGFLSVGGHQTSGIEKV